VDHCEKLLAEVERLRIPAANVSYVARLILNCLQQSSDLETSNQAMNVAVDLQCLLERAGRCDDAVVLWDSLFEHVFAPVESRLVGGPNPFVYSDCKEPTDNGVLVSAGCYGTENAPPTSLANVISLRLASRWELSRKFKDLIPTSRARETSSGLLKPSKNVDVFHFLQDVAMFANNYVVCAGEEKFR
jgi:hypothetical protein